MKREELSALRERVEKADGPDREIDAMIAVTLDGFQRRYDEVYRKGEWEFTTNDDLVTDQNWIQHLPRYTGSMDAAARLIQQKLPGWEWQLLHEWNDVGAAMINRAHINDAASGGVYVSGYGPTPALALIAALLNALENTNG